MATLAAAKVISQREVSPVADFKAMIGVRAAAGWVFIPARCVDRVLRIGFGIVSRSLSITPYTTSSYKITQE